MRFLCLILLCVNICHAFEETPLVKGILLVGKKELLAKKKELIEIEGIELREVELPSKGLEKHLEAILGEPFNHDTIRTIKNQIYQFYRDNDRPLVLISLPNQRPATGTVQVLIEESRLGEVKVVGNKWTPAKRYENYFATKPGETISQRNISRDMDFINRGPFRAVNVSYSPGARPQTTDVTLEVVDRRPYFFYAGCDNAGVPTTGRQRIFAGFGWDQIWGADQSLYYQYTTNYNTSRYHSNTFQYVALCPWKGIFNLYGGFSTVSATLDPSPLNNKGTNAQASLRYITPFGVTRQFSQEIIGGFDWKNTNNTLEFSDATPVFGQTVNITQWIVGYKCRYEEKNVTVEGDVEGVFSPFQWFPNQTSADYESLRPGADNRWFYLLANCFIRCALPHKMATHIRINGEASLQTLLPSEQLGVGGYDSVRGYDQRQFNGDSGLIVSWELHSPPFTVWKTKVKKRENLAHFLYFLDGGLGYDNVKVPDVPRFNTLAGTGIGLRYFLSDHLKARIDYGIKLHQQADFTGGASEVHFNVTGSF